MRITSWNILHGQPLVPGQSSDFAAVAATLSSDVLALQELDMKLERSGSSNQASEIAAVLETSEWGFAPTVHGTPGFDWKKPAQADQRVFTKADAPLHSHYGIAIVSKVPVKQWLRCELGKAWIGMPLLIANEKGKPSFCEQKETKKLHSLKRIWPNATDRPPSSRTDFSPPYGL